MEPEERKSGEDPSILHQTGPARISGQDTYSVGWSVFLKFKIDIHQAKCFSKTLIFGPAVMLEFHITPAYHTGKTLILRLF